MKYPSEEEVLAQTIDALEMPRSGVRKWLAHDRRFCEAHGGERVYAELLELLSSCERTLDQLGQNEE